MPPDHATPPTTPAPTTTRRRPRILLNAAVVLLGALPLLASVPAPLQDWPSHLARVWITARVLDGDPFWAARYGFQGYLIPNAILDVAIGGLMRLGLGIDAAGAAFLLLLYASFIGGFCALSRRVAGHSALAAPLAVTCFYNMALFYGLVNYLAGVSLILWSLVAWQACRGRWAIRALLALPCVGAIALCHLLAAFMFVGVAGLLDLAAFTRRRRARELLPPLVALLAAAGALLLSPVGDDNIAAIGQGKSSLLRAAFGKAATFGKAMASGQPGPDLALILTVALLAAAAAYAGRRIPRDWVLVIAALVVVTVLAPFSIGEGTYVDARLATLPFIVLAASFAVGPRAAWLAPALAALVVARVGLLAADWHRYGRFYAALESTLAELPPGSTLLAAKGDAPPTRGDPSSPRAWIAGGMGWFDQWSPPLNNMTTLAARHGIFVPSVFASRVQQPLYLRPEWRAPWPLTVDAGTPAQLDAALARARTDCRPGIPTNLIVLYPTPQTDPDLPQLPGLPPHLQSRFRIVNAC